MLRLRKILSRFVIALMIALAIIFAVIFYFYTAVPLIHTDKLVTVKLPPGTGSSSLARRLQQKGLIHTPWLWKYFIATTTWQSGLKAGEYQVKPGMSFQALVSQVAEGEVYLREVTLVEGWTYPEIKHLLQTNPHLKHVIAELDQAEMMTILGSDYRNPEGLLFPDTYFYTWGDSDLDIIKQSYGKMRQLINQLWPGREHRLPYKTVYAALTAASLIEKETALPKERPLVASVIVNRLRAHMRLQIDPTVIYGLGGLDRPLTHADLRHDTPYNTYIHHGLPPTPIAMPSESSIKAALHPAHTNYLYFVARGDGSHQFSVNYEQHLDAVRRYMRKKKVSLRIGKKPIKSISKLCQLSQKNANVNIRWLLPQNKSKYAQCVKLN